MNSSQQWIEQLGLEPHPEGGWYRQSYRAPLLLPEAALPGYSGARAASTAIYFLLAGDAFSAFHRLRSDEVWHFYAGSRLTVHVIEPDGEYKQILLGSNTAAGEHFQAVVPSGCWFGSALADPVLNHAEAFALVGCTVAPGFDFADFEMAKRDALTARYSRHSSIISRLTSE